MSEDIIIIDTIANTIAHMHKGTTIMYPMRHVLHYSHDRLRNEDDTYSNAEVVIFNPVSGTKTIQERKLRHWFGGDR